MRKVVLVLCVLFACVGTSRLVAAIYFSNPQSTINLNAGSTLFIDAPVLPIVGGTVTQSTSADIVGGMVFVENEGHFIHGIDSTAVGLFGNFKQLADGSLTLDGNARLSATFGPISGPVNVSSSNNRIEGSAYFQSPITLADANTVLTLAVDNVVNQPIYLNSGTIILESDLSLGYSGVFVGPGVIDGKGMGSLHLSGTMDQWSTPLTFRNMHTLEITGETVLTGTWSFQGESNMVGGGTWLDTRGQGGFDLSEPHSVLKLNGMKIGGIKQGTLSLSPTSTIFLSDSTFGVSAAVVVNSGTYVVKSSSLLQMGKNDFSVVPDAHLVIDGSTLWLDCDDDRGGQLFSSATSTLIKGINGGSVRQLTDLNHVNPAPSRILLSGGISADVTLVQNVSLSPGQAITYLGSAAVDGSGVDVLFSKGDLSQLNIPSGVTADFKNVNLLRIANNTFNLSTDATFRVGNDVLWELDQDVTLTTGRYIMSGSTDVWTIRGSGGRKKLTLAPRDDNFLFNIGSNTVLLEDIELVGIENVQYSFTTDASNNRIIGAVALMDTSVIDITKDTNLSILVQNRDAGIVVLTNNITLSGTILFGLAPENTLNIFFALQTGSDLPVINFGDGLCTMSSFGGNAGINFINDAVTLNLLRGKSLIAGERSFISGKTVVIQGNPIRVASTQFTVRQGTDLSPSGMLNPIDLITTRSPSLFSDLGGSAMTAYHQRHLESMWSLAEVGYESYLHECVRQSALETRGRILIPTPTVRVMGRMALSRGVGNIALTAGGSLHEFLPDNFIPFSVSLTGGSVLGQRRVRPLVPIPLRDAAALQLASDGTYSGIKEVDTIYVTQGANIVQINSDFTILGTLSIDDGAELVFQLANGAVLTFGNYQEGVTPDWVSGMPLGYQLNLPPSSTLRFTGNGTVRFADGSEIICNGSSFSANASVDNALLYNDDRPEIVIENFARVKIDDHHRLTISGRGKINVTSNGEIGVVDGRLTLGTSNSDFFDFNVSRQGYIRASLPKNLVSDTYVPSAHVCFNNGFFNLSFRDRSALEIGDRGLVEVSLKENVQTRGFINTWSFASQAVLTVSSGGTLSFGQNRYAPAESSNIVLPMLWDNRDGDVQIGGSVQMVDGTVSGGRVLFKAKLQRELFATDTSANIDIVKTLAKVTTQLIRALDYRLVDGTYKLITPSGISVTLNSTDTLISEDPQTGEVTGLQLDGRVFKITNGGLRRAV